MSNEPILKSIKGTPYWNWIFGIVTEKKPKKKLAKEKELK